MTFLRMSDNSVSTYVTSVGPLMGLKTLDIRNIESMCFILINQANSAISLCYKSLYLQLKSQHPHKKMATICP